MPRIVYLVIRKHFDRDNNLDEVKHVFDTMDKAAKKLDFFILENRYENSIHVIEEWEVE